MRDRFSAMLPFALALGLVLALAGCDGGGQGGQEGGDEEQEQAGLRLEAVEQWAESPHARVITSAAERPECARCHDGATFTEFSADGTREETGAAGEGEETTGGAGQDEEGAEEAEAPRDWFASIDCRVCHSGTGVEIAESGTASIPGEPQAEGGTGALCMTCHNSRHEADPQSEERDAPHYSPAADVLLGINIMPTGELPEDPAHAEVNDTCVGCHMQDENGDLGHEFAFANWEGCSRDGCHEDDPRQATEDYDGDGTEEQFQEEIEGMLEAAQANIEERAGGTFMSERGGIVFMGPNNQPIETVDDDVYAAAYNYLLIENDGSRGLHNPELTVEVLRSISGGGDGGTGGAQESTETSP